MTLRPLIAGNWKMNGTPEFGESLVEELIEEFESNTVELAVFPSFTSLYPLNQVLKGSGISLGAQNVHAEPNGAHTGEISTEMLQACGVKYVILGHSERRAAGETNEDVAAKASTTLEADLVPIVCIGENAKMEPAKAQKILEEQLHKSLENLALTDGAEVVIAYEPVWAIGTGLVPTIDDLKEAFSFLRELVIKTYGENVGSQMRLLYGGSLNATNAEEILAVPHINGGLIGGASLKADSFLAIAKAARKYAG